MSETRTPDDAFPSVAYPRVQVGKSEMTWAATKAWLLANPDKRAAIATPDGTFIVTLERSEPAAASVPLPPAASGGTPEFAAAEVEAEIAAEVVRRHGSHNAAICRMLRAYARLLSLSPAPTQRIPFMAPGETIQQTIQRNICPECNKFPCIGHAAPAGATADETCEHGTAIDVHCCNCHGWFLFDVQTCVCKFDPPIGAYDDEQPKCAYLFCDEFASGACPTCTETFCWVHMLDGNLAHNCSDFQRAAPTGAEGRKEPT
jgi:hypothetical protein